MKQVAVDVSEDEKNVGYALIVFRHGFGQLPSPRIRITRRSHDSPCLGADGWQAAPTGLPVDLVSAAPEATVFRAKPEVCRPLKVYDKVAIEVEGANVSGTVFWPEITSVAASSPSAITLNDTAAPPAPPPAPAPPPPESPPPPPPPQAPPPRQEDPVPAVKGTSSRPRKVWRYLVPAFLVVIAAGAFLFRERLEQTYDRYMLVQRFESLKASDQTGAELFDLSVLAVRLGANEIASQAVEIAHERGNIDAKLQLARWHDPRYFDSTKVDRADANLAGRYYFEIAIMQEGPAAELLDGLCAESRDAASSHAAEFGGFLGNIYCEGVRR